MQVHSIAGQSLRFSGERGSIGRFFSDQAIPSTPIPVDAAAKTTLRGGNHLTPVMTYTARLPGECPAAEPSQLRKKDFARHQLVRKPTTLTVALRVLCLNAFQMSQ